MGIPDFRCYRRSHYKLFYLELQVDGSFSNIIKNAITSRYIDGSRTTDLWGEKGYWSTNQERERETETERERDSESFSIFSVEFQQC